MRAAWFRGAIGVVIVSLASLGCGSADYGEPPGASGSQVTFSFWQGVFPEIFVEVVDDTPAGEPLRSLLGAAFDDSNEETAIHDDSCRPPADPAVWSPVDRAMVVVHPSAVGSARFSSPATEPALRWHERNESADGRSRWLSAVHDALAGEPAAPGAPFEALAAYYDSVTLLGGARKPTSSDERALVDSLPEGGTGFGFAGLVVATEDQSPGDLSQYASEEPSPIIVPAATPDPTHPCAARNGVPTPRYAGWGPPEQLWPCTAPDFFGSVSFDCGGARCLNRRIQTTNSGAAVCVVTASFLGTDPCPNDLGWIDPIAADGTRKPRIDHDASGDSRVCEVQQLQGAALESCKSELDCTECEPGWCATEVAELLRNDLCETGTHYTPFRFVHGASSAPESARGATFSIVCDESTAP